MKNIKPKFRLITSLSLGIITVPVLIYLFTNWPLDPTNSLMSNSAKYRENFKKASEIGKMYKNNNIEDILSNENYGNFLKEIGIEIDKSKIIDKKISEIDFDIHDLIKFKYKKANFKITKYFKLPELGRLIVYIKASEQIISDPENNQIFVIIDGFQPEKLVQSDEISKEGTRKIKNNIGIKIINNESQTITNSNGFFFDYAINEDENYPKTWYLLVPIHSLEYFSNINNYELTSKYLNNTYEQNSELHLFNSNESISLKDVNLVFAGFDIFKSNLNYLKKFSNNFDEHDNLEEYVDFAVLEVKFDNEEDAKKFTSISEVNYFSKIFLKNDINFKVFDKFNFQFINSDKNSRIFNAKYWPESVIYKYNPYIIFNSKTFNTSLLINNNFISKLNFNNINGSKYIDITTGIGFSETGFNDGSSGSIIFNNDFFGYKVSNYRNLNVGIYVPLIWNNIEIFKNDIVDKLSNSTVFDNFILEPYDLIYGNEQTQKNWYLMSLKMINPTIKTYLSSLK
ncbi:hypothetical protein HUN03_00800 [Mycoplasmopsis anatis]|uniref:DUF31 family protein n=1 Tax=Mycoplasmopsis anatis TaxID=171279 RepID=UPI001C4DEC1A|nr:DUF31 family protein [Mycoplasmopsis anatis]MBW0594361.1 hypothetical protein [Mycoplasmopsis anatis]MBW0595018.1 hypothetical protein [Mycoplasmopsis anatis]MBW0598231.1 hypothetical protein [Mycoplasmopsis anatis]MBW0598740.1 hypothetical protein [Mycoplasmopsis anatis]MBW0600947.1 hypothetical protein [Mycoplasmopsis anatis]